MSTALSVGQIAGLIKYYSGGDNGRTATMPIDARNGIIAVAVCLAESGGRIDNKGGPNKDGTYDWGLWQINDVHKPSDDVKTHAYPNWQAAYSVAGGGKNWRPWSTYNNGKYLQFMGAATTAWGTAAPISGYDADKAAGVSVGGQVDDPATINAGPFAFLDPLFDQDTWVRVGMAVAGVLLILIASSSLIKRAAIKASPVGSVIKAVTK